MRYFPFIHKLKKKDRNEPLPLYIEVIKPPPQPKIEEEKEQDTERGVVIIEL